MFRARRFLLQPTTRQRAALGRLLDAQRELYNAALEERRGAWRWEQRSVTRYEQFRELTGFEHPLLEFGLVPARGTLARLDRAFAAFYRRCRDGETPGYPRFKSATRFASVDYDDRGCWGFRPDETRIRFMGVGNVKFKVHRRPMQGTPKTCVLRREGSRWFACVVFVVDKPEPLPSTEQAVGIDLGVEELIATSDGELVKNPRHFRRSAARNVIAVDPRRSSTTCHACGHVDGASRTGAVFRCLSCGHEAHADINAARNILRAGLARRRAREAGREAA